MRHEMMLFQYMYPDILTSYARFPILRHKEWYSKNGRNTVCRCTTYNGRIVTKMNRREYTYEDCFSYLILDVSYISKCSHVNKLDFTNFRFCRSPTGLEIFGYPTPQRDQNENERISFTSHHQSFIFCLQAKLVKCKNTYYKGFIFIVTR